MDMVKMMEQAMELSKLMNNNAAEDNGGNDQMNNMLGMMQMLKLFSGLNAPPGDGQDEQSRMYNGENYYDDGYYDMPRNPAIETIKAAIPYLEYKYQKSFGIMLKLMEIEEFLISIRAAAAVPKMEQANWHRGMLGAIRPQVDSSKQQMIDILIRFIDLKEVINTNSTLKHT